MMHGREKSDSAIVAGKPTNKAVSTAAEPVERRAEAKGNASQQSTRRTQSRVSVSHALERIRQTVTKNALPSHTQGGSRMPELGPYGSVRGALSNERPYRDLRNVVANYPFRRVRQKDDAPEVQRRLLRPTYSVSDMKEGLEGTRYKSVAAFFNHLRPSQEIDGLLGIVDKNILKDASFLRRDPSALQ